MQLKLTKTLLLTATALLLLSSCSKCPQPPTCSEIYVPTIVKPNFEEVRIDYVEIY